MSEPNDEGTAPLKATLKAGAGYEAPWLTVNGDNAEDLYHRLQDVVSNDGTLLTTLAEVAEQFRAAHVVAAGLPKEQPQSGWGGNQQQGNQGGGSEPPPAGKAHTCPHGVRIRREGTGSKGKWVGFFCPLKKGDPNQCDPEWGDPKSD